MTVCVTQCKKCGKNFFVDARLFLACEGLEITCLVKLDLRISAVAMFRKKGTSHAKEPPVKRFPGRYLEREVFECT